LLSPLPPVILFPASTYSLRGVVRATVTDACTQKREYQCIKTSPFYRQGADRDPAKGRIKVLEELLLIEPAIKEKFCLFSFTHPASRTQSQKSLHVFIKSSRP
jgi:hypothetical protein